jgi:predicted RNA-binding Zn-ribbon protein involved in translation (DUF1610 family)
MVPTETRPKNTLFCPECGHESPVDGDWEVHTEGTRDVFTCPACGAAVTTRCRSDGPDRAAAGTPDGSSGAGSNPTGGLAGLLSGWRRRLASSPSVGSRP